MSLIRNIAKTFFPAFAVGTVYCCIEMFASRRPFMSFGLMLICIGMTLACANVQMYIESLMKGESKNGRSYQSNRKAA